MYRASRVAPGLGERRPPRAAFSKKRPLSLDGLLDEILHVVDKRENAEVFQRVPTIARLAERLAAAANKSTNI